MRISDLDYDLPDELIAQEPLARRDASRLLLLDVAADEVDDRLFTELPGLLPPSLFVFNDTRVFPARLLGHKATGGRVELLLLRKTRDVADRWLAMGRSSKGLRAGMDLSLCEGRLTAHVVSAQGHGQLEVDLQTEGEVDTLIEQAGEVPLPRYIRRAAGDADRARYQTVYARHSGSGRRSDGRPPLHRGHLELAREGWAPDGLRDTARRTRHVSTRPGRYTGRARDA